MVEIPHFSSSQHAAAATMKVQSLRYNHLIFFVIFGESSSHLFHLGSASALGMSSVPH